MDSVVLTFPFSRQVVPFIPVAFSEYVEQWCEEKGQAFVEGGMRNATTNVFTAARYAKTKEKKGSSAKKHKSSDATCSKAVENKGSLSGYSDDDDLAKRK